MLFLALPQAASASLSSSGPITIDGSTPLLGVACPAAHQCTAVDLDGRQVTFDPASPGTPTPTTIDGTNPLNGEACPSTSQCTAVDDKGDEVTFNPTSPGTPTPMPIDSGAESGSGYGDLKSVACPSTSQCTAIDSGVTQVTFNPNSPGTTTPTTIDDGAGSLTGVACPSTSQCTAVDNAPQQMTFDPTSPFPSSMLRLLAYSLFSVACPSTSQCTAGDDDGHQVTFNPNSPGTTTPTTIDGTDKYLRGVACPSTSQCTAVDNSGQQVTFDPTSPGTPTPTTIDSGNELYSVACPSTSQCTAVDHSGHEVTFDPIGATKAKQECVVPKLKGKRLAAAKKALKKAHCAAGRITSHKSSTVPKGRVISSSPKMASKHKAGTKIALTVSGGKRTGAQATGGGRIAACSNETVTGVTLRFVLHGVSCNKAHSLIRAYFRHATPGYCANRGTACSLSFAGGWDCARHVAGEHDGVAGCVREAPFATVTVYTVTGRASTAAEPSSLSIADELTGVAATSAAAKRSCGSERVKPGTRSPTPGLGVGIPYRIIVSRGSVSCRKARSLIRATGEGKGHWHETRAISGIYTRFPGGWSCAAATGGNYGCWRGRRIGASGYADEVDGIQR